MRNSIFLKIFLNFFLIIILLAFLVFAFSFRIIKQHYITTLVSDLKNLAFTISPEILPFIENKQFKPLDSFVKGLRKKIDTRITIISPDGLVYADSEKDPATLENHRNRPEVKEALKSGFGYSIRYSTTVKKEMLYVAIPLMRNGNILAFVRVSLFLADINRLLGNLRTRLFLIVLAISLFALIFAFLMSRSLSKPIIQLAKETKSVADGNFDVNIDAGRGDEIGLLAGNFVEMARKLKVLFEDLKFKQEELSNIISSLSEAIVVLNEHGEIIFTNKSFKSFFGSVKKGDSVYQSIRSPSFLKLIENAKSKGTILEEVVINERQFLCSVSMLDRNREIIVVLRDLSQLKELERIKKDFVVNASHELRTPLTAIKGYLETLEGEVSEEGRYFLDVVKKNTDRLVNIVNDLLTLASIEEGGIEDNLSEVDLSSILVNVVALFVPKAEKKGLSIEFNKTIQEKALIKGDAFRLEQVFVNLVDNAIKYTDKGKVSLTLKKIANGYVIEVKDTGIGIPQDSVDRIFERFYVVDKSRSKKMGGTGLGLSIVKHIVMLHGGSIKVETPEEGGSVFSVFLPFNF